ncbi:hypothetical protein [uncultured Roseobacter sp.]|uniref:hypothetical protein n=1 Tax=uncultured Roseobacter sp. TaxID=114847 RepID=UPI00261485E8|nr:hypothetical protein [uncultured Roseobacter sp.]
MTESKTDSWDSDALLAKAQQYAEVMNGFSKDDWQYGLWSSLCLELLARAALAKVSPTLLADLGNWHNIYYSLGKIPNAKKFVPKSVGISEVIRRQSEIDSHFDTELKDFCLLHVERRNAELHSSEPAFDGLKPSAWLPTFFRACNVLLDSLSVLPEEFWGADEAKLAQEMIDAAKDETAKAVLKLVAAHNTTWNGKDETEQKTLLAQAEVWATRQAGHRVACPACGTTALVNGDPVSAPQQSMGEDLIVEKQDYLPSKFECIACGLKIAGLSHLSAAGVGDIYVQTSHYTPSEFYELEDPMDYWEDDNNEPI